MRAGLLAFIGAVIATTRLLRETLGVTPLILLLVLAGAGFWLLPRGWRWPCAALLGIIWTAASAQLLLERQLSAESYPADTYMQVVVTGVPEQRTGYTLFYVRPQQVIEGSVAVPLPRLMRLRWYHESARSFADHTHPLALEKVVYAGQVWRLRLQLRPPDGFLNPSGFDYQRWLFVRQIGATGQVVASEDNQLLGETASIHAWRQHIAQAMSEHLSGSAQLGLIQGLGVAVRDGISAEQWRLLTHTGTAHLLAISGMHIGMVAAVVGWLFATLWCCIPALLRWLPALLAGILAGSSAAVGYAALAGFTLPTQRALIMVAVFACALLTRRPLRPWNSLLLAAAVVLVLDPWAPLGAGFWLSFSAVAVILIATQGRPSGQGLVPWLRLQAVVGLALLPATALWFGNLPWLSPIANWIAVPWVSLAVVPLVLLGVVLLPVSDLLVGWSWKLADLSLAALMAFLSALEALLGSYALAPPNWPVFLLACLGVLYMLAPRGLPGRWLALPLVLTLVLIPAAPRSGEARIVAFDTGGGMAVLIHSQGEAVVYGAGPGGGLDAVSVALEPYVEVQQVVPVAWIVPREEDPWAGARLQGRRKWRNLTWVDTPYDCSHWQYSLGHLELASRVGETGCELLVTGNTGRVVLKPRLLNLADQDGGNAELGEGYEGADYRVGMIGCYPTQRDCVTALIEVEEPGKAAILADTGRYGAITLTLERHGWCHTTCWHQQRRVFHSHNGDDGKG